MSEVFGEIGLPSAKRKKGRLGLMMTSQAVSVSVGVEH
jgi:hypothetical protein